MSKGCSAPQVFLFHRVHGTRLRAHALNPTMHRTSVAKTATLNSASIMVPSTESTLEGLIPSSVEIFPVAGSASDGHHSLVLLIGGLLMAQPCSDPRPSRFVTVVTSQDQCFPMTTSSSPAVP
jgi:hypothetical protein